MKPLILIIVVFLIGCGEGKPTPKGESKPALEDEAKEIVQVPNPEPAPDPLPDEAEAKKALQAYLNEQSLKDLIAIAAFEKTKGSTGKSIGGIDLRYIRFNVTFHANHVVSTNVLVQYRDYDPNIKANLLFGLADDDYALNVPFHYTKGIRKDVTVKGGARRDFKGLITFARHDEGWDPKISKLQPSDWVE